MPAIHNPAEEKGFTQLPDGAYIETATLAIIDAIRNYAPNVDVLYLDPARADKNDLISEPWMLVERCPDGLTRKIFGVWEMNWSVLERLQAADSWRTNVLDDIDKHNAAIKKAIADKHKEADAERADLTAHIMASPKGNYTFHGEGEEIIKISDDDPRTRKEPSASF